MNGPENGDPSADMRRVAIVVAMLCFAQVGHAESPGAEPIQVPDIRANIMKMLREGKGASDETEEDLFAEAERQQKEKGQPLNPAEVEGKPVAPIPVEPLPQAEGAQPGSSVELPVKEIVIEDLDDLKKLAEELKKAKKRQAGRQ